MPAIPYEPQPIAGIEIAGGDSGYRALDLPSRCTIHRLIVHQTDGVIADFTVELYSTENAAQSDSESDSVGVDTGLIPKQCYKVGKTFQGVSGHLEYNTDNDGNGYGYPFFSHEKSPLGNRRKIYVVIRPGGSGAKRYAVAMGAMTLD